MIKHRTLFQLDIFIHGLRRTVKREIVLNRKSSEQEKEQTVACVWDDSVKLQNKIDF